MTSNDTIYDATGEALVSQESTPSVFTIEEYAYGLVNFEIPQGALKTLFAKRDVDMTAAYSTIEPKVRELIEADIYTWIVYGVSRMGATTDSDNGWSHSGGSYSLTEEDKKRFLALANTIYEKYDEPIVGKPKVIIRSYGIMPANRDFAGNPLEHIVK